MAERPKALPWLAPRRKASDPCEGPPLGPPEAVGKMALDERVILGNFRNYRTARSSRSIEFTFTFISPDELRFCHCHSRPCRGLPLWAAR